MKEVRKGRRLLFTVRQMESGAEGENQCFACAGRNLLCSQHICVLSQRKEWHTGCIASEEARGALLEELAIVQRSNENNFIFTLGQAALGT